MEATNQSNLNSSNLLLVMKTLVVGVLGMAVISACGGAAKTPSPLPPPTQPRPTARPTTPGQLPDLMITGITLNPKPVLIPGQLAQLNSGVPYDFTFEVINRGPGQVGNVVISVDYACVAKCSDGPVGRYGDSAFVGHVEPGKKTLGTPYSITFGAKGTYKLRFKVDPDNIYHESDESNNEWQTSVIVI